MICDCGTEFVRLHPVINVCQCGRRYDGDGHSLSDEIKLRENRQDVAVPAHAVAEENVGDELRLLIPDWVVRDKDSTCGCDDWRKKLNRWRVRGCRENEDLIIDHLVSQSDELIVALRMSPKILRRVVARNLIRRAISNTERKSAAMLNTD